MTEAYPSSSPFRDFVPVDDFEGLFQQIDPSNAEYSLFHDNQQFSSADMFQIPGMNIPYPSSEMLDQTPKSHKPSYEWNALATNSSPAIPLPQSFLITPHRSAYVPQSVACPPIAEEDGSEYGNLSMSARMDLTPTQATTSHAIRKRHDGVGMGRAPYVPRNNMTNNQFGPASGPASGSGMGMGMGIGTMNSDGNGYGQGNGGFMTSPMKGNYRHVSSALNSPIPFRRSTAPTMSLTTQTPLARSASTSEVPTFNPRLVSTSYMLPSSQSAPMNQNSLLPPTMGQGNNPDNLEPSPSLSSGSFNPLTPLAPMFQSPLETQVPFSVEVTQAAPMSRSTSGQSSMISSYSYRQPSIDSTLSYTSELSYAYQPSVSSMPKDQFYPLQPMNPVQPSMSQEIHEPVRQWMIALNQHQLNQQAESISNSFRPNYHPNLDPRQPISRSLSAPQMPPMPISNPSVTSLPTAALAPGTSQESQFGPVRRSVSSAPETPRKRYPTLGNRLKPGPRPKNGTTPSKSRPPVSPLSTRTLDPNTLINYQSSSLGSGRVGSVGPPSSQFSGDVFSPLQTPLRLIRTDDTETSSVTGVGTGIASRVFYRHHETNEKLEFVLPLLVDDGPSEAWLKQVYSTLLKTHHTRKSNGAAEKRFQCLIDGCDGDFPRKAAGEAHIKTHINVKPFECLEPGCGSSFVRKHDLKRHGKIHTGDKTFICDCDRRFARADALERHRQRGICSGAIPQSSRKRR